MSPNSDSVEPLTSAMEAVPRLKELAWRSPERVVGSREFQKWREDTTAVIADVFGPESDTGQVFRGDSIRAYSLLLWSFGRDVSGGLLSRFGRRGDDDSVDVGGDGQAARRPGLSLRRPSVRANR